MRGRSRARIDRTAKKGLDPKQEDPGHALILETCIEDFIRLEQKAHVSADRTRRLMLRLCKKLLRRPIGTIPYHESKSLLAEVAADTPHTANVLHAYLSGMFKWAKRSHRRSGSRP